MSTVLAEHNYHRLLDLAPKTAKVWVDLGSGAGFPGMILAVLLKARSGAQMQLIESNGKKCIAR